MTKTHDEIRDEIKAKAAEMRQSEQNRRMLEKLAELNTGGPADSSLARTMRMLVSLHDHVRELTDSVQDLQLDRFHYLVVPCRPDDTDAPEWLCVKCGAPIELRKPGRMCGDGDEIQHAYPEHCEPSPSAS